MIPSVETPVTCRFVNEFGAFAIADSMVDVVVASREAMFWSSLPELTTWNESIYKELVVVIPETSSCCETTSVAVVIPNVDIPVAFKFLVVISSPIDTPPPPPPIISIPFT